MVRASTSRQVIPEVISYDSPRGASRRDRRMDVIPDPREAGLGFPACGNAGSCFFRVEREESPYKRRRGGLKKREEEEDGQTDKRAGERTNGRTKTAAKVAAAEEEKKEKKDTRQSAAFVRFSARLALFAVLPVSSLFLPAIGRSRNGRIKER